MKTRVGSNFFINLHLFEVKSNAYFLESIFINMSSYSSFKTCKDPTRIGRVDGLWTILIGDGKPEYMIWYSEVFPQALQ